MKGNGRGRMHVRRRMWQRTHRKAFGLCVIVRIRPPAPLLTGALATLAHIVSCIGIVIIALKSILCLGCRALAGVVARRSAVTLACVRVQLRLGGKRVHFWRELRENTLRKCLMIKLGIGILLELFHDSLCRSIRLLPPFWPMLCQSGF